MGVSSNALRCRHQAYISDEEEGSTDAEDADKVEAADTDDDADDEDAAPDDNNYATMPPKVKPQPRLGCAFLFWFPFFQDPHFGEFPIPQEPHFVFLGNNHPHSLNPPGTVPGSWGIPFLGEFIFCTFPPSAPTLGP